MGGNQDSPVTVTTNANNVFREPPGLPRSTSRQQASPPALPPADQSGSSAGRLPIRRRPLTLPDAARNSVVDETVPGAPSSSSTPRATGVGVRHLELVSRGEFREFLVAGQGRCETEEGQEVASLSLVSDGVGGSRRARRSIVRSSSDAGRGARWIRCRAWRYAGRCRGCAARPVDRRSGGPYLRGSCQVGAFVGRVVNEWRGCPGPAAVAPGCRGRWRRRRRARGVSPGHRTGRAVCCPSCRGRPDCARSAIPPFCADGGRVHDGGGPVQLTSTAELVQHGQVQSPPQSGFGPRGEPAMCGGWRYAERLG